MNEETKWVVFDCEADGLRPTKFYCLAYEDHAGVRGVYTDYDDIRDFFRSYDVYVGHNIRRWDLPNLERVVGITVPERIVDTLGVSWYLNPERQKHNLESFGDDYGIEKPFIPDWHVLSIEKYIHRCEQDVLINTAMWKDFWKRLMRVYEDPSNIWNFLRYLDFKLICAKLQEDSKWKINRKYVEESLDELTRLYDERAGILRREMPRVEVVKHYKRPVRYYRADGELTSFAVQWEQRLERLGMAGSDADVVAEVVGTDEGNPNSHEQLKAWLYSLGWVPQTIKYVRDKKTGEIKEIPQINKEANKGGGVCDSVKKLYEKDPSLENLDGIGILSHRMSILKGFLRDADEDDFITARVSGLTNTLRFKHAELVNLPKPEKEYGEYIRASLIAPDDDHELCGSDMAGVEDRIKQHYIYPYDPEYVESLMSDDYDPHLDIGVLAGGISKEDADLYKAGDATVMKRIKPIRGVFKNGNYALM